MALRWGIASVGLISQDFVQAVSILPPENHKIIAVASRSPLRATAFADSHKIPISYGDYKSLAEDANVGNYCFN